KPPTRLRAGGVISLLLLGLLANACGGNHSNGANPGTGGTTVAPTTAPAATDFGTLASPCGHGTAKGATANGVTDTSLTIGYGDDAGYAAAQGLDKEMSDAMKPMIAWCNDQGGINGRTVVGKYYDAKVLH